jgi:hypothetical protein
VAVALSAPAAYAQGGVTTTLNGTVTDSSGAVIPGASVTIKRADTGVTTEAVTNAEGQFTVPALNAGTYTVTVSLAGFKTVTLNDVILNAGVPAGVKVVMEVGGLEEQVVVQAASEIVNTQSSNVAQTISAKQIQSLPLTSRDALQFVGRSTSRSTEYRSRTTT